jgi:hypothetical protein
MATAWRAKTSKGKNIRFAILDKYHLLNDSRATKEEKTSDVESGIFASGIWEDLGCEQGYEGRGGKDGWGGSKLVGVLLILLRNGRESAAITEDRDPFVNTLSATHRTFFLTTFLQSRGSAIDLYLLQRRSVLRPDITITP